MGDKVSGRVTPETVKPAPLAVTALTVTADVPLEVRVTDCVAEALTFTLPKARLLLLTAKPGLVAAGFRFSQ